MDSSFKDISDTAVSQEEKVFRLFANQLSAYFPEYTDTFLCPYCFQEFHIEDLSPDEHGVKKLTRAHIIPDALGGKGFVLACKSCNNNLGTILDSVLAVENEKSNFVRGINTNSKFKWRLEINGVDIGLEVNSTPSVNGFTFSGIPIENPKVTNPASLSQANNHVAGAIFAGKSINAKLRSNYKEVDQNLLGVALLNISYLLSFQIFGYPYILSRALASIRHQILSPYERILTKPFMQKNKDGTIPEWGLSFFGEGAFAPCYALQWAGYVVLLPLNDDVELRVYSKIENYLTIIGSQVSNTILDAGTLIELKKSFMDYLVPDAEIELNNAESGQTITVFGGIHSSAKSVITGETREINWKEVRNKKVKS